MFLWHEDGLMSSQNMQPHILKDINVFNKIICVESPYVPIIRISYHYRSKIKCARNFRAF